MEVDISVYIYQRVVGDEHGIFVAWNWGFLDVAEQSRIMGIPFSSEKCSSPWCVYAGESP